MRVLMRVFWAVSSVVEHCLHTAGVRSSNLLPPTNLKIFPKKNFPKNSYKIGIFKIIFNFKFFTMPALFLSVYAQPGAKKTDFAGKFDSFLKIRVKAAAKEGKANAELQRFLADFFHLPKSAVVLLKGETARHKQLRLNFSSELDLQHAQKKITALL